MRTDFYLGDENIYSLNFTHDYCFASPCFVLFILGYANHTFTLTTTVDCYIDGVYYAANTVAKTWYYTTAEEFTVVSA